MHIPVVYGYLGIHVLTFLFLLLKVVASGIWVAPGDSEEISVALSQSLRNCIERLVFLMIPKHMVRLRT